MTSATLDFVTQHEASVPIVVTRCDGPGCAVEAKQIDHSRRFRGDYEEFTEDSKAEWFWLGKQGQPYSRSEVQWEFCSFDCVRQFMLGKASP